MTQTRKVFAALFLAAACLLSVLPAQAAVAAPAAIPGVPTCALPDHGRTAVRGEIHVVGNHEVNGFGRTWVPYGISVAGGLQDGDGNAYWTPTISASMAQIEAAPYWHANTVRLQWAEGNIFSDLGPGEAVNTAFLNALCAQVQQIRRQGEVAVLNDNTEFPDWTELDPTQRTEEAWQVIYEEFGNQPGWIADIYNEPRVTLHDAGQLKDPAGVAYLWRLWQQGGLFDGQQFIGMPALVAFTRSLGFTGVEWVEGPFMMGLHDALQFPVDDPLHDIVYTFHHPGLPRSATRGNTKPWTTNYGYLTRTYPVVDSEWNQSAAPKAECQRAAYYVVPTYFRYLRAHGIGLVVWSLQPGSMVAEPRGVKAVATNTTSPDAPTQVALLERPSRLYRNYACDLARTGEGAGRMVLNYFSHYSTG